MWNIMNEDQQNLEIEKIANLMVHDDVLLMNKML